MSVLFTSLLEQLQHQLEVLPDKSEENADITLRALWAKVQGQSLSSAAAAHVTLLPLDENQQQQLQILISQRLAGTPLAHITERQAFMGLELLSSPAALIPRAETAILGNLALRTLAESLAQNESPLVIDICTGSGNIALTIAHHFPNAQLHGADLSSEAVTLAIENSRHLQLHDRAHFRQGDLLEPFRDDSFLGKVDMITCNPPYVTANNVKKMAKEISHHEPEMAFDGGPIGIAIIERTIKDAATFLRNGAWLCMEVGAGQGPFVEKRIRKSGCYDMVETACDEQGIIRALRCRKNIIDDRC